MSVGAYDFAFYRAHGWTVGLVVRVAGGWVALCPNCEVSHPMADEDQAWNWTVTHNVSLAHLAADRLF